MREYMAENHITYYRLGNEEIDAKTMHRIRHDQPLTSTTIEKLCRIMNCQPGDLMEYIDEKDEPNLL